MKEILLVDDSRTILVFMGSVLKSKGFKVFTANSGEEALQILAERDTIQFVLSDWLMPEMSGIELCQTLKSRQFGRYIFFVLLSSNNDQQSIITGIDAGADDFVDKKTSVEELEARIHAGFRTLALHNEVVQKNTELDAAYETIKRDLESAGDLIKQILPKQKHFPFLELSYISIPSAQIGGDMLGYMQLDSDHVAFYLIDVAGHGVSSALMSFSVQQSLSLLSGEGSIVVRNTENGKQIIPPEGVIERLNQIYASNSTDGLYFTMIYAVLNTKNGVLSYCCAGHPPLVWYRSNTTSTELIGHDNFVVGAFDGVDYQAATIQLEAGDRVWFYSDGITEADNGEDQFTEDGLRSTIANLKQYPTQQQTTMLVKSVQDWRKNDNFDDDVSLLVAEWKGSTKGDNLCDMKLVKKATAQFFE
ncbi:fused response regulator/phosphatase [Vibrio ponticus]|uniref:Fused response regulator/phosphatase n=1 Tax=Vibrio ponticus TaxID=265668 RepID=A0A3N3DZC2_9VIBR|nr:fused response regulator/phosphatase [Vibrio ponticus]ROV59851.1 fused response regulator/phosphatase [Vibrio ponticus]